MVHDKVLSSLELNAENWSTWTVAVMIVGMNGKNLRRLKYGKCVKRSYTILLREFCGGWLPQYVEILHITEGTDERLKSF